MRAAVGTWSCATWRPISRRGSPCRLRSGEGVDAGVPIVAVVNQGTLYRRPGWSRGRRRGGFSRDALQLRAVVRQEIGVGNGGASEASGVIVVAEETLARVGLGHRRTRPPRPSRAGAGGRWSRHSAAARALGPPHPPPWRSSPRNPSEGHGSCDGTARPRPRSSINGPTGAVSGARPRTRIL